MIFNEKLGYYVCRGRKFNSKLKAMVYGNPTNSKIDWVFNDEAFSKYDWSIEPSQSLDDLYDKRARELREQYDYITLSYSGGSDSNNVLESFLRQNLFIDEIVTTWPLDITEKYTVHDVTVTNASNNNAEFKLHTVHRLNYIKNKSPGTKITVHDSSKSMIETMLNYGDEGWTHRRNDVFNMTGLTNYNLRHVQGMLQMFDQGKKVCFIVGTDKPKLRIIDDKLYLYFVDKATGMVSYQDYTEEYGNVVNEFFYWSPDAIDMLCKQAHTVLKHIKSNPILEKVWEAKDYFTVRVVQERLLKSIIYSSSWDESWFQVNKCVGDWDCEFDRWFTEGMKDTVEFAIWFEGLKNIAPQISNYLAYEKNGKVRGSKTFFSKYYFIGNVKEENL